MSSADQPPDRWQKLKDLFNDALDLDPEKRSVYLASVRVQDEALYEDVAQLVRVEEAASSFLREPVFLVADQPIVGQTVGHYRIVREIGRGGMGTVFEAVRHDGEFEQKVALKFTNHGVLSDDLAARFRIERQLLAKLEHKNIVRLLDGGVTTERLLYCVMEYVEGAPLTVFCRDHGLQLGERLNLFLQVCDAVAYTHRQLVVHRDLKPSNILVTKDREVKLLDFGIAKLLDDSLLSPTAGAPLTPEYASPEQIRGDAVSTASDIYSLGIILYELLTGLAPCRIYGIEPGGIYRAVCENEPLRPSTVLRSGAWRARKNAVDPKLLRGDLDNIVLKALHKDPNMRYPSVEKLADDVKAHLEGRPAKAHPQSLCYRMGKFLKRNRLLAATAAISLLLVMAGVSIAAWQFRAAQREQLLAERRFSQGRKFAHSLIFDYYDEITKIDGSVPLREKLIAEALAYLDEISREQSDNPDLIKETAVAYRKIGDVQGKPYDSNLGDLKAALKSYERSVALLQRATTLAPADTFLQKELIESYRSLAQAEIRAGRNVAARNALQNALIIRRELLPTDEDDIERRMSVIGLLAALGDAEDVLQMKLGQYKQALEEANSLVSLHPDSSRAAQAVATLSSRIGNVLRWQGDKESASGNREAAQDYYEQAVRYGFETLRYDEKFQSLRPDGVFNKHYRLTTYQNIAVNLIKCGRIEPALRYLKLTEKLRDELKNDADNSENRLTALEIYYVKHLILSKQGKSISALENATAGLTSAEEAYRKDSTNVELISWAGFFADALAGLYERTHDESESKRYRLLYEKYAREHLEKFGREMAMNF